MNVSGEADGTRRDDAGGGPAQPAAPSALSPSKQTEEDAREPGSAFTGPGSGSESMGDDGGNEDKSGDMKVLRRRARRREIGANARQRERAEVDRLEKELMQLQELVSSRRTLHLCVQCTGLERLFRDHPTLAQDKLHAQEKFKVVLRVLQSSLDGGRGKDDAIPGLINESMTLFRNLSSLSCSIAWHGAALLVMQDGFFMNSPAMPSLLGDLPMSTWLLTYLSREGANLPPATVQDLTAVLKSWTEVEDKINAQMNKWLQVVREQSVGYVQTSLLQRLQPTEDRTSFVLHPRPEADRPDADEPIPMSRFAFGPVQRSSSFAGPGTIGISWGDAPCTHPLQPGASVLSGIDAPVAPAARPEGGQDAGGDDAVMPLMVCCCQLGQQDEEFRCWALSLLQRKLGMWDFAQFLVTRLTYEDAIREMVVQHSAGLPAHKPNPATWEDDERHLLLQPLAQRPG